LIGFYFKRKVTALILFASNQLLTVLFQAS
jgi:hypothetical protein